MQSHRKDNQVSLEDLQVNLQIAYQINTLKKCYLNYVP